MWMSFCGSSGPSGRVSCRTRADLVFRQSRLPVVGYWPLVCGYRLPVPGMPPAERHHNGLSYSVVVVCLREIQNVSERGVHKAVFEAAEAIIVKKV